MRRIGLVVGVAMLMASPIACQRREVPPLTLPTATATAVVTATVTTAPPTPAPGDPLGFERGPRGGTLVIGQAQEPNHLYIYGGSMLAAAHVLNSIYDGPIEGLDYDFQPVILETLPRLEHPGSGASLRLVTVAPGQRYVDPVSYEVVTATAEVRDLPQLSARFRLKPGITWQDGTPVTADDSVFSWDLNCHPKTPTSKFTCDRTARYRKVDERTVLWQGLPGFTDQTYYTNFATPLPRHQTNAEGVRMADMDPAAILSDETFTRKPYSYGPFKIEEWVSGDHITLIRNEHYWRRGEGLPHLDAVIHKVIPDSNALLAAVSLGEVQVATQDGLDISQSADLDRAAKEGRLVPYYVAGTAWEHIDFNLNPVDDRIPLGACLKLRQAIALGTDRETIVKVIQRAKGRVQHTFVPEEHWAYPPSRMLVKYPYDPARARRLLSELGFADHDADPQTPWVATRDITCTITVDNTGRQKEQRIPKGTPLELDLLTTSGVIIREDTTLLFEANMREIGIRINLDYQPADVVLADGPQGPIFGRRFDLGQFAWLTGVQPPVALYYCTEIPAPENGWSGQNETGWCDPQYDRVAKRAAMTLQRSESLPLYHQAQQIFMTNLPVLPLFARVKVMATTPDVMNFRPNPTVNSETWNIETWALRE